MAQRANRERTRYRIASLEEQVVQLQAVVASKDVLAIVEEVVKLKQENEKLKSVIGKPSDKGPSYHVSGSI